MRDYRYENFFEENGIKFTYLESIDLSDINIQESLHNSARRSQSIIPWLADRYAKALKRGTPFPAIVGFQTKSGVKLATGNHRLSGAQQLGWTTWPHGIYLIEVSDQVQREIVTREINNLEGQTTDREEAMEQAKYLVRSFGATAVEMAARFGLGEAAISLEVRADKARDRLVSKGIKTPLRSPSALDRLGSILNDQVMLDAHNLAVAAKLTNDHVNQLVTEINEQRSDADALAVVSSWRDMELVKDRIAATGNGKFAIRKTMTRKGEFLAAFTRLSGVINKETKPGEHGFLTDQDKESLLDEWSVVETRMEKLLGVGVSSNGHNQGSFALAGV